MNEDILSKFAVAEPWSLTLGSLGRGLILSGLGLFLISAVLSALSAKRPGLAKPSSVGFVLGSLTLFGAFAILGTLFAKNQFQYSYVAEHGDIHTALQYKIAGIWSGQQGSFLLWAVTSAIFGILTLWGTGKYRPAYVASFGAFLATLCGILAYESPFGLIQEVVRGNKVFIPPSGNGLAPSLMNYWVVIHPPTIFLGFGSLTVMFAYVVAAIFHKDIGEWVSRVRPWTMVSTAILGVGICMGGLWAYETLGWGGFWAWDPVENASFVPWLFVVTLVHGVIVQTTRKRWHGTNLWLGALPFLTFCYGTFLTRGGYLDNVSVHSFASMDKSALTILKLFLLVVVVGFSALYIARGRQLARAAEEKQPHVVGMNRETLYGTGVLMISLMAVVLAMGMSWPLITAIMGRGEAQVHEGLYHQVVVWFFVPIMILIAVTPFAGWKTLGFKAFVAKLANVFSLSVALTGVTLLLLRIPDWGIQTAAGAKVHLPMHREMPATPWIAVLFLVCAFAFVGNVWRVVESLKRSPVGIGGFIAHVGIATLFAGLIMSRGFEQQKTILVQAGHEASALGFTVAYEGLDGKSQFDPDEKAKFEFKEPNGDAFMATPGIYFRPTTEEPYQSMRWPYIRRYAAHDFYVAMGNPIFTVWEKPESLQVGQTKTVDDIQVTYKKFTMEGTPGTPSARFGADLHIVADGASYDVTPHMGVSSGPEMVRVNQNYFASMEGMDAADRSARIQLWLTSPIFPLEIFTKPLTIFVWIGAGVMAIGSLLSAYYRRRVVTAAES